MKKLFLLIVPIVVLFACQPSNQPEVEEEIEVIEQKEVSDRIKEFKEVDFEVDGIKLTGNNYATSFPNAKISLVNDASKSLEPGSNIFEFNVDGYELTGQTGDEYAEMCANSEKGQHIHFIMDNAPYVALYGNEGTSELEEGHHVLLAFLSRSYHMSIKHSDAFLVEEFNVGSETFGDDFVESDPHMFYSRPKGTYKGEDAKRVLLDFFLINTDLRDREYKVRATINGTEFVLEDWMPYVMEGLPMGENTIVLELLDGFGNLVESPFNPVERTFELVAE